MEAHSAAAKDDACPAQFAIKAKSRPTITVSTPLSASHAAATPMSALRSSNASKLARRTVIVDPTSPAAPSAIAREV